MGVVGVSWAISGASSKFGSSASMGYEIRSVEMLSNIVHEQPCVGLSWGCRCIHFRFARKTSEEGGVGSPVLWDSSTVPES